MGILNVNDLITKRLKEEDRFLTLNIEAMGGDIKLRVPTPSEMTEIGQKYSKEEVSKFVNEVIYSCCVEPRLNDTTLIETLGCKGKVYNVVDEIFKETKYEIFGLLVDEIKPPSIVKKVADIKN